MASEERRFVAAHAQNDPGERGVARTAGHQSRRPDEQRVVTSRRRWAEAHAEHAVAHIREATTAGERLCHLAGRRAAPAVDRVVAACAAVDAHAVLVSSLEWHAAEVQLHTDLTG